MRSSLKLAVLVSVAALAAGSFAVAADADPGSPGTGTITIGQGTTTPSLVTSSNCVYENTTDSPATLSIADANHCLQTNPTSQSGALQPATLTVTADQGSISIADALSDAGATGGASLTLDASGDITQTATISCQSLSVSAGGAIALTGANNVGMLADATTGSNSALAFTNSGDLTINGPVSTGSGAVSVNTTGGSLAVGGAGSVTTTGSQVQLTAAYSLTVSGPVDTRGQYSAGAIALSANPASTLTLAADLTANSVSLTGGTISQGGGTITSGDLVTTSGSGGTSLTSSGNQVAALDRSSAQGAFTLRTASFLDLRGDLAVENGALTLQAGNISQEPASVVTSNGVTTLTATSGGVSATSANSIYGTVTGSAPQGFGVVDAVPMAAGAIAATTVSLTAPGARLTGNQTASTGDFVVNAGSSAIDSSQATLSAPQGAVELFSGPRKNDTFGGTYQQATSFTPSATEFDNTAAHERWGQTRSGFAAPNAGDFRFYYANQGTVGVDVTAAPTPVTYGTGSTLTATLTPSGDESGPFATPTGSVSFTVDGHTVSCGAQSSVPLTPVPNSTSSQSTASCTSTIGAGQARQVVATYQPDTTAYPLTSSSPISYTVGQVASQPRLTTTPSAAVVTGDGTAYRNFSITAQVPTSGSGAAPTGTVTFTNANGSAAAAAICNSVTLVNGSATCTTDLPTGTNTIGASYTGDGNYSATTAANLSVEVDAAPTISPSSVPDATVAADYSQVFSATGGFPADAVFSAAIGSVPPGLTFDPSSGVLSGTPTVAGTYTFTLTAASRTRPSTSSASRPYTMTVEPASTGTTVSFGANPVAQGTAVTLTATVSPAPDGGTVDFYDGNTLLGNSTADGGLARLSTSDLARGPHDITAKFGGSANYVSSTGTASLSVEAPPQITTTSLPGGTVGSPYSQTIAVAQGYPAGYALTVDKLPTGLSLAGNTVSGTPRAGGTVTATFTATNTNSLKLASNPVPIAISIAAQATSTSLSLTPNPASSGHTITATATVSPAPSGGTVVFSEGGNTLDTVSVDPSTGVASTTVLSSMAKGVHAIVARYSGDASDLASSSGTQSLEIDAPPVITTATLPVGSVDSPYVAPLSITDGYPSDTIVTVTGLPDGLQYDTGSGVVSGTPQHTGDFAVTISAINSAGMSDVEHLTLPVGYGRSSTVLTVSPSTVSRGGAVTASVQVSPALSAGTVQFLVDGNRVGSPVPLSNGAASSVVETSGLDVNGHTVTALYSGTSDYGPSQDHTVLTVTKAATTTAVSSTARGLTASLTSAGGTPAGYVDFVVGGRHLGMQPVDADGVATLPRSGALAAALTDGTTTVQALYLGGAQFATSGDSLTVTAPQVAASRSPRANRYGWADSPVTVRFTCVKRTAAVVCPRAVVVSGQGRSVVRRTVVAADGGTTVIAVPVAVDSRGPAVEVSGARDGANYGSKRTLHCHASDPVSGVASCRLDVSRHGNRVHWIATAIDRAGNLSRNRGTYRIDR